MPCQLRVDLRADLNTQDDDGNGWSLVHDAADVRRIVPGAIVLAGNEDAQAVVRVLSIDEDGQAHFTILPGPLSKNRQLLDRATDS